MSFISPLSEDFCDRCNRLRLTADGAIKSCLLYPAEVNVRDALHSGASDYELAAMLQTALSHKNFAHPPLCKLAELTNRCMAATGG